MAYRYIYRDLDRDFASYVVAVIARVPQLSIFALLGVAARVS